MNKTQNYQLSQWEAEDLVQRTDFNADNARIDAAVKALADSKADRSEVAEVRALASRSRFTKLWERTLSANENVEINLSGVDWKSLSNLHLDYLSLSGEEIGLRVNTMDPSGSYQITTSQYSYIPRLTFPVGFQAKRDVIVCREGRVNHLGTQYENFQKLYIVNAKAGARIILWGEA